MQMTAVDLAYIKGEASAQPGDTSDLVLQRATENRYLVPGPQRDAFMAGFLSIVENGSTPSAS